MSALICPSILAADFADLAAECERVADDADWLHVDVMDNHFVPNLTIGLPVVEALLRRVRTPIDCHLMIDDPDRWAPEYASAGAASVTFHLEAATDPIGLAQALRREGARAGAALKPDTELADVLPVLPHLDVLLLMTVEPGFGGQAFRDDVLPKIAQARARIGADDLAVWIQVDGGVTEETIVRCAEAGADMFVAGTAVYGAADPGAAIRRLRSSAEAAGLSG